MSAISPQILVYIIGTPQELGSNFTKAMSKLEMEKRKILWEALPINTHYSDGYFVSTYKHLSDHIFSNFHSHNNKTNTVNNTKSVLTLFFKKQPDNHLIVSKHFGVETFVAPIDFNIYELLGDLTPNKLRQHIKTIAKKIKKRIQQFEKIIYHLQVELSSKANSTPLLLPFHHFGEVKMEKLSKRIQTIIDSDNPNVVLNSITKDFVRENPRKTDGTDRKKYFQNSSGLMFKPPGKHLHGFLHIDSKQKHPHKCYTRASLRFGVAFKLNFHFDCIDRRGTILTKQNWSSCHDQEFLLPQGRKHINIAPNNHVR